MTIKATISALSGKLLIFGCLSLLANTASAQAESVSELDDLSRKLEAFERAVDEFRDANANRQSTPPSPMPIPADAVVPEQVAGQGESEVFLKSPSPHRLQSPIRRFVAEVNFIGNHVFLEQFDQSF